jgi:autotransporter strand-loop-strand O-heptosyltransferase
VVWESTRFPDDQFENLLSFDQLWVPSNWQKECAIEQGYPSERVKVVPEGVHQDIFYPEKVDLLDDYNDGRFKFLLFGRWDYRKSTTEIIETFLKTFDKDEPVDLIASIDNPFSVDGMDSTEERLKHYGFKDDRIKIKSFVSREDYIKYMKIGHVFLSCARSEGWNLPLIEAMACGIPSIYSDWGGQLEFAKGLGYPVKVIEERPYNIGEGKTFNDGSDKYEGNYCEPDYNDLSKVMREVYENYQECRINSLIESEVIRKNFNWENAAEKGYKILKDIEQVNYIQKRIDSISVDFNDGATVTINGRDLDYKVDFIDGDTNKLLYSNTIKSGHWTKCYIKYYVNWLIRVSIDDEVVYEYKLDLRNKKVHIQFSSESLGDTLAWIPYVEEFRKKHNCEVVCTTFWNKLFKEQYPDIEFIEPGSGFTVSSEVPSYEIGWFYDDPKNPNDVKIIPLQQTSSDILGLNFKELIPKLKLGYERPIEEKYVCISMQSTAQCKYWNWLGGWQEIVDYLNEKGYKVVCIDKHKVFGQEGYWNIIPNGVIDDTGDKSLERRIQYLEHCDFFIGISNGLSWLAWGSKIPIIMISSFTKPFHEFQSNCIRVYNDNDNSGYYHDNMLDKGNWNWNPLKEINSMDDWYEVETIIPQQVKETIENIIKE